MWLTNLTITGLVFFLLSLWDISISSGLVLTFMASPIRITTSSVDVHTPSVTAKISNAFLREYCSKLSFFCLVYLFLQSDLLALFLCG